jgi:hypothetical protein
LIYLHNYFIIHDIKYFFSIKLIRQFRGAKQISSETNYQKNYQKILFFKIQKDSYHQILCIRALQACTHINRTHALNCEHICSQFVLKAYPFDILGFRHLFRKTKFNIFLVQKIAICYKIF